MLACAYVLNKLLYYHKKNIFKLHKNIKMHFNSQIK